MKAIPIRIAECGCCGSYHRAAPLPTKASQLAAYDCRNDAERFASPEDAAARLGVPVIEVDADGSTGEVVLP